MISPLIALMKNQVDAIRSLSSENGIAHVLNSSLTKTEINQVKKDPRVLAASPFVQIQGLFSFQKHVAPVNLFGVDPEQESKLTYRGEPNLENDSYVLFLAKKYAIEKNDLLGKYVLNDSLYSSLDEALKMADGLEIEQRHLDEKRREKSQLQAIADAKAQKADNRRLVIGSVALLIIASIVWFYYVYGNKEPNYTQYDPPKGVLALPIAPSFDCTKAHSATEKLICSDSELAIEDNELFDLYKQAKAKSNDPVAFKAESVDAWKARERYCHDKICLLEWYGNRKAYYQDILQK